MIISEKKLRELDGKLNTNNLKVVSDAIITLRNEEPFRGAIDLLAGLFDSTDDIIIKDLIRNFLNDIKEPAARIEVIDEVMKVYKPETLCMLVCSCWQSGLDYSEFASKFAEIFIRGDYLTALECFTVIEGSVQDIEADNKSKIIELLEKNGSTSSDEKTSLLRALITVLR